MAGLARRRVGGGPQRFTDVAYVDRTAPVERIAEGVDVGSHQVGPCRQSFRVRCVGSVLLMTDAFLGHMERRRQVEDGLSPLDGCHPSRRKRLPIANPIHLVQDRDRGIAGTEEVGVQ
jgi:hypothetical protein